MLEESFFTIIYESFVENIMYLNMRAYDHE